MCTKKMNSVIFVIDVDTSSYIKLENKNKEKINKKNNYIIRNGLENVFILWSLKCRASSSQLHKIQCSGIDDMIGHKSCCTSDYIWINRGYLLLMRTG